MRAPKYFVALAEPKSGVLRGTWCASRAQAAMLLADRFYNGDAFPGEFVARIPYRVARKIARQWGERVNSFY